MGWNLLARYESPSLISQFPNTSGNGGIRLLNYKNAQQAIEDAVRLAKGMTRKHDMFRTGFSGAKVVVNSDHDNLDKVERKELMQNLASALKTFEGGMYTGCDLNTCDTDMDYLVEATDEKYVLAGRNSKVDTNVATASSVIGSILGTVEAMQGSQDLSDLTFTVQGCGKVGSTGQFFSLLPAHSCQSTNALRASSGQGASQVWSEARADMRFMC